ncbi:hypothetical protein FOA52_001343 [Chlamydomonas sp. UWO 241]|nr:hypothetical protein FOA52_001343 [Chlamydomonas sp. UWO 241]
MHGDRLIAALAFSAGLLVYLNSLPAGFVFDDNFAVIYNGDVTSDANRLSGLLAHDFWGQNIISEQSHKSYRPLTVLAFRLLRQAWDAAPKILTAQPDRFRAMMDNVFAPDKESDRRHTRGVNAMPYHALNVLLHAIASALVSRLAHRLLRKRARAVAAARLSRAMARVAKEAAAAAEDAPAKHQAPAAVDGGGGEGDDGKARGGAHPKEEGGLLRQRRGGGQGADTVTPAALSPSSRLQPETQCAPIDVVSLLADLSQAQELTQGSDAVTPTALFSSALLQPETQRVPIDEVSLLADLSQAQELTQRAPIDVVALLADLSGAQELTQVHLPALLAALAFALHPVHCEAVAGVVGMAETLCFVLSIPALLLYISAADSDERVLGVGAPEGAAPASSAAHWGRVAGCIALAWCAALAKEIGITVLGAALLYDILLVPLVPPVPPTLVPPGARGCAANAPDSDDGGDGKRKRGASAAGGSGWLAARKAARLALLCVCGALYVKARGMVAGDQLVRIYRKVENPIAFAGDFQTRLLSTAHLHARYAWLLIFPRHLSCDWSFSCIPLVESVADPRNAASIAMYAAALAALLMARPWRLMWEWTDKTGRYAATGGPALAAARWRLAVLLGLSAAPFLPASNIFFYVGTFIAERLMYMPSVGFVLLCAEAVACALEGAQLPLCIELLLGAPGPRAGRSKGSAEGGGTAARAAVLLACAAVLVAYASRTWARNWDWMSEEQLFVSAQGTCWDSAKVQLNSGVLERRRQDPAAALRHFELAKQLDPSYCEPDYWIGLTLLNLGRAQEGVDALELAVGCKYVKSDSVQVLNTVYHMMAQSEPTNAFPMLRWAQVLMRPDVALHASACHAQETTAMMFVKTNRVPNALQAVDACVSALDKLESPTRLEQTLKGCVTARRPLLTTLAQHGPTAPATKQEVYKYLTYVADHPDCRTDCTGQAQQGQGGSMHMHVMHAFQSADADDAWLQVEWGETLLVLPGRMGEAALHIGAGAMMMDQAAHGDSGGPAKQLLSLKDLTPLSKWGCLLAAASAYERCAAVNSAMGDAAGAQPCTLRAQAASMRIAALRLVRGDGGGSAADKAAQVAYLEAYLDDILYSDASCFDHAGAVQALVAQLGEVKSAMAAAKKTSSGPRS